ncbi:unnamed protein product [Peniophora sp. CBMAI 1063]|nr:unnamed protein product [Peniophora sp. CBMAI 1063]
MTSLAPSLLPRPSAHSSASTNTNPNTPFTPLDDDAESMNPVAGGVKLVRVRQDEPLTKGVLRVLTHNHDAGLEESRCDCWSAVEYAFKNSPSDQQGSRSFLRGTFEYMCIRTYQCLLLRADPAHRIPWAYCSVRYDGMYVHTITMHCKSHDTTLKEATDIIPRN